MTENWLTYDQSVATNKWIMSAYLTLIVIGSPQASALKF